MRNWIGVFLLAVISCQPVWAKKEETVIVGGKPMAVSEYMRRMLGGIPILDKEDLDAAIAKADAFPLGTKENPVRAESPAGQHAYLARLKCADNSTPSFMRAGNLGPGVYGSIIDAYTVRCGAADPVTVIMDMYFKGYVEMRPVPGFTIDAGS